MSDSEQRLIFGAVADDDTGAGDLAGMLTDCGVRTILMIDVPAASAFTETTRGYQAAVIAVGTRSVPVERAEQYTRDAVRVLRQLQPRRLYLKYCSTFDSTVQGNIGPAIATALNEIGENFTVAVPALPVGGRTTYMGYHFVHDRLLSDSPLRNHPLNPMTHSDLVDFLGRQTSLSIGLAPYPVVEAGPEALQAHLAKLRQQGKSIAIVDCLNDGQLGIIAEAVSDFTLTTGSSALAMKFPAIWRRRGWLSAPSDSFQFPHPEPVNSGVLLVAGSCSPATRAQNDWLQLTGAKILRLNAQRAASGELDLDELAAEAESELAANRNCLISISSNEEEVRLTQQWAAQRSWDPTTLGLQILKLVADLAARVASSGRVRGWIFAGGETAGYLCRRLGLGPFHVGSSIEPGVPLCYSLTQRMPVVLKSGNFGGGDFYGRALEAMANPRKYFD
jgi:uncharacterized protein YgbK (DUF1537 family)